DKVNMPSTPTDYSYGRQSDGGLPWVQFSISTPNASNDGGVVGLDNLASLRLSVYPNPTQGLVFFSEYADFKLIDLSGRVLEEGRNEILDMSTYAFGMYMLKINEDTYRIVRQ